MNITFKCDDNFIYILPQGRIDASNTAETEAKIKEIRNNHPDLHTVIDAEELSYISSAGLRVILRIRKEEPGLRIVNVSPAVYDIFEMTGFTEMISIEKAFPRISIDGCEFIAKGANGAVFRYDDETIVKQYYSKDALPDIKQERENARKAFVLGVNTAIPYGIVRIGDGYGTVTELLNANSMTKVLKQNPENIESVASDFIETMKNIHSVKVFDGELPDYRDWVIDWAYFLKDHLEEKYAQKLIRLTTELPVSQNMIHGDYHTNNVLIQNGEPLIIDLDTLSVGSPVHELGSMYNAFVGFSEIDNDCVLRFLGIDYDLSRRFWKLCLINYLGTDDIEKIADVENKAKLVGYTRILRRSIRRGKDSEYIEYYRTKLMEMLDIVDNLEI